MPKSGGAGWKNVFDASDALDDVPHINVHNKIKIHDDGDPTRLAFIE